MKISLDYDGTIWQHQEFFKAFIKAMQAAGHKVGMLTAHRPETKDKDIALMVARGFSRPDFYIGRPSGTGMGIGAYKAKMIEENNIDYHFDDCDYNSPKVIEDFGDHPRLFKCWFEKPKGSHIQKPNLPKK